MEILEIMPQMWQYVIFLSLKPTKMTSDFILNFLKKFKGCHHSEILNTNIKYLIYSKWIQPQGSLGCQKMSQGPLHMPFEVWCTNIAPKLKNIWNIQRKQVFLTFVFNFDDFSKFVPFWGVLSAKTQQFICKEKIWFFDIPGTTRNPSI